MGNEDAQAAFDPQMRRASSVIQLQTVMRQTVTRLRAAQQLSPVALTSEAGPLPLPVPVGG